MSPKYVSISFFITRRLSPENQKDILLQTYKRMTEGDSSEGRKEDSRHEDNERVRVVKRNGG